MDESDSILVARAIRGDRDAFKQLYSRYFSAIYYFVLSRVNNPADAEDLAHVVFTKALGAIGRFTLKHDRSFLSWLYTIADNAVNDTFRQNHNDVSLDALGTERLDDVTARPDNDPESRLTAMELQQALTTLTREQRDVVHLRFFAGFSPDEIGAMMGKQANAVRGIQFRALAALRRALSFAREGDTLD